MLRYGWGHQTLRSTSYQPVSLRKQDSSRQALRGQRKDAGCEERGVRKVDGGDSCWSWPCDGNKMKKAADTA